MNDDLAPGSIWIHNAEVPTLRTSEGHTVSLVSSAHAGILVRVRAHGRADDAWFADPDVLSSHIAGIPTGYHQITDGAPLVLVSDLHALLRLLSYPC